MVWEDRHLPNHAAEGSGSPCHFVQRNVDTQSLLQCCKGESGGRGKIGTEGELREYKTEKTLCTGARGVDSADLGLVL